jgi:hypothetical protein
VLNVLSFPDFNLVFMRNVIYYTEKAGMSVTRVTNRGNVMYIFWLETPVGETALEIKVLIR